MTKKDTIFSNLIKYIPQKKFIELSNRYDSDRYVKKFYSWEHLLTMIYCQITRQSSLRDLEISFNSMGGIIKRSTLSDANERRDPEIFKAIFLELVNYAVGKHKRQLKKIIEIIDSTPIQLKGFGYKWTKNNHRIRGLKTHVVYSLNLYIPKYFTITDANVNDIEEGRKLTIVKGTIYVFDKGYYDYKWWNKIKEVGSWFVTRSKRNMRYKIIKKRQTVGNILRDVTIKLTADSGRYYPRNLRLITVKTEEGKRIDIITNKLRGDAQSIADLYKKRWQIELFFKWLKQNLKIKKFIGHSRNAVKIQLITAMITYLLIWILKKESRIEISTKQFIALIRVNFFCEVSLKALVRSPPIYAVNNKISLIRGS